MIAIAAAACLRAFPFTLEGGDEQQRNVYSL